MNNICVLSVYVEDLAAARRFYVDTMGFEIKNEYGDCILQLHNDGVAFLLEQLEGDYPGQPCVIPAIKVTDLVAEISRLKQAGVDMLHEEPQDFPAGRFVACRDGTGNLFEVLQFN
ncbi:MAG: VOC family protein [Candidatus Delongbacteria bacterium]|nr:VOC family protein [Candidatus Delongbacteria bacterium]